MAAPTILIYGATGYSGRLIAAEAARALATASNASPVDCVLAGRDSQALDRLAATLPHRLRCRAFALDDPARIRAALDGVAVVINAAGPFQLTAEPIAHAAILSGCHAVDISGELDVYKRLDDLGRVAGERGVTLVSGAGQTAAVSDVLLHHALALLKERGQVEPLGAVRIAASRLAYLSRGSVETMLRGVREQVAIVRAEHDARGGRRLVTSHAPIGVLERSFDFTMAGDESHSAPRDPRFGLRIASAVNLVDTLTARHSCQHFGVAPERIESYVEMPALWQAAYQAGAMTAVALAWPPWPRLMQSSIAVLPEGPSAAQRSKHRHRVLLQIESRLRESLIDWRIDTPDPYTFTARSAWAVAVRLATRQFTATGWQTPGALLSPMLKLPLQRQAASPSLAVSPFDDCRFDPVFTADSALLA